MKIQTRRDYSQESLIRRHVTFRQQPGLEETREGLWEKISPCKTEVARENDALVQNNSRKQSVRMVASNRRFAFRPRDKWKKRKLRNCITACRVRFSCLPLALIP